MSEPTQETLRGAAAEYAYHSARFALRGGLTRAEWEAQNAFWFGQAAADHAHSEVAAALESARLPDPEPEPEAPASDLAPITVLGVDLTPETYDWLRSTRMWHGGDLELRINASEQTREDAEECGEQRCSVHLTWRSLVVDLEIELAGHGDTIEAAAAAANDLAGQHIPGWAKRSPKGGEG